MKIYFLLETSPHNFKAAIPDLSIGAHTFSGLQHHFHHVLSFATKFIYNTIKFTQNITYPDTQIV